MTELCNGPECPHHALYCCVESPGSCYGVHYCDACWQHPHIGTVGLINRSLAECRCPDGARRTASYMKFNVDALAPSSTMYGSTYVPCQAELPDPYMYPPNTTPTEWEVNPRRLQYNMNALLGLYPTLRDIYYMNALLRLYPALRDIEARGDSRPESILNVARRGCPSGVQYQPPDPRQA